MKKRMLALLLLLLGAMLLWGCEKPASPPPDPDVPPALASYGVSIAEEGGAGTWEGIPTEKVNERDSIRFAVTPKEGLLLKEVKVDGKALTPEGGYYTLTITGDTEITAVYEQGYVLTIQNEGGSISGLKEGLYPTGAEFQFSVTAKNGYAVSKVLANGEEVKFVDGKYLLTVSGNTAVAVEYTKTVFNLELVNDNSKGNVTNFPQGLANAGTPIAFKVRVADPKWVPWVRLNGKTLPVSNNEYRFTVEGNSKVEISYYDKNLRTADDGLDARRKIVEAEMRKLTATLFYFEEAHEYKSTSWDFSIPAGSYVRGIPYAHGNDNLASFLLTAKYQDDDGVYHMDESLYLDRWGRLLGASCADAVYWSWNKVSSSISCTYAQNMTEVNGCIPVGDYEYSSYNGKLLNTKDDCEKNTKAVMYEAYAKLLPGDGMVFHTTGVGGHAILVSEVYVVRDYTGAVDAVESYIRYHDTNGGYRDVLVEVNGKTITAWSATSVDKQLNFASLFSYGYLPMTCLELMVPDSVVEKATVEDTMAGQLNSADALVEGVISSNYYISHVTLELKDAKGKVQSYHRHNGESTIEDFDMAEFTTIVEESTGYTLYKEDNLLRPETLEKGDYHCKVTVFLGNGESFVVRDFDFAV